MLSTILYSINPKTGQKLNGFVSFSESDQNTVNRKAQLIKDVESEGWTRWSGGRRRDFVEGAKKQGYDIKVSLCLIEN
jgi:hypothetical protein